MSAPAASLPPPTELLFAGVQAAPGLGDSLRILDVLGGLDEGLVIGLGQDQEPLAVRRSPFAVRRDNGLDTHLTRT